MARVGAPAASAEFCRRGLPAPAWQGGFPPPAVLRTAPPEDI